MKPMEILSVMARNLIHFVVLSKLSFALSFIMSPFLESLACPSFSRNTLSTASSLSIRSVFLV